MSPYCLVLVSLTVLWCSAVPCDANRFDVVSEDRVGFTFNEKVQIIRLHNDWRRKAGASNMKQLFWNYDLEKVAQAWTQQCQFTHNYKRNNIAGLAYKKIGENLYLGLHWRSESRFLQQWYDEKRDMLPDLTCDPEGRCGHYEQMMWYDTEAVGCGLSFCKPIQFSSLMDDGFYVTCNYGPEGNVRGELFMKAGEACSECPEGHICVAGLCAPPNCSDIQCHRGRLVEDVCMCDCTGTGYEGPVCEFPLPPRHYVETSGNGSDIFMKFKNGGSFIGAWYRSVDKLFIYIYLSIRYFWIR